MRTFFQRLLVLFSLCCFYAIPQAFAILLPTPQASIDIVPAIKIYVPDIAYSGGLQPPTPTSCFLEQPSLPNDHIDFKYAEADSVLQMAGCLKVKLEAMLGTGFAIDFFAPGTIPDGIVLARADDVNIDAGFTPDVIDPITNTRDQYRIFSHANGVLVLGATYAAVEIAMWRMLSRMGYAQLAPGPNWEVIPENSLAAGGTGSINVNFHIRDYPAFYVRQVKFGNVPRGYDTNYKNNHLAWLHKNGLHHDALDAEHVWGNIEQSSLEFSNLDIIKDWFDSNSDAITASSAIDLYTNDKLCVQYSDVNHSVTEAAIEFTKNRTLNPGYIDAIRETVSMSSTDGADWYDLDALGAEIQCDNGSVDRVSPSDRSLWLANQVAQDMSAYPDLYGSANRVAMFAYHFTSLPPVQENVASNVLIIATDGYLMGGLYFDKVVRGWKNAGASEVAAYSYWGRGFKANRKLGLPGAPVADGAFIRGRLQHYFNKDIRAVVTEGPGTEWGGVGLGMWALSRLMHKPDKRLNSIKNAFLNKAFPGAQAEMDTFYNLLNLGATSPRLDPSPNDISMLYEQLILARTALTATPDPTDADAELRLDDLEAYVRYLDLYWAAKNDAGNMGAINNLYMHLHQARDRHIVPRIESVDVVLSSAMDSGRKDFVADYEASTSTQWENRSDSELDSYFSLPSPSYYTASDFDAIAWQSALGTTTTFPVSYSLTATGPTTPATLPSGTYLEPAIYDASDLTEWIVDITDATYGVTLDVCAVHVGSYNSNPDQYQPRDEGYIKLVLSDMNGAEVCSITIAADEQTWNIAFNDNGIGGGQISLSGANALTGCSSGGVPAVASSTCAVPVTTGLYKLKVRRGQRIASVYHRMKWVQDSTAGATPFGAVTEVSAKAGPDFDASTPWAGYFYVPATTPAGVPITNVLGYYSNPKAIGFIQVYDTSTSQWIDVHTFGNKVSARFEVSAAGYLDTVWRFKDVRGQVMLLNVPPYIAMRPEQLLIP